MFRSALLILSGNAAASLLLLARNLIVARLIPVEDYGIAATFAITMAVVEMMSQLGLQQQIIQAKDGDDPRFQAALQGFQVLRGVIAGVLLFLAAGWIADFLHIPHVAWAYQVMALVPIFNALQHFDIHRLNREMRFWPVVLTGAVPALISLVALWPLYLWFGDYKVMLWAIIVQIGLMMVVSHLVAERPYRLVLDRAIMGQSLRFGWPLLINGMLMFAVFNGDKLIVGRALGMETLAIFAMGFTLTLTPVLVASKSLQSFFLPQLSLARQPTATENSPQFTHIVLATFQCCLLVGTLILVVTVIFGPAFILALLGEKYAGLVVLLPWLAILQALRTCKGGPSTVGLACGQTSNPMIANIPRVLALPLAWWVVLRTGDVFDMVLIAILAELAGLIIGFFLIKVRLSIPMRPLLWPILSTIFIFVATLLQAQLQNGENRLLLIGAVIVVWLFSLLSMRELRMYKVGGNDKGNPGK